MVTLLISLGLVVGSLKTDLFLSSVMKLDMWNFFLSEMVLFTLVFSLIVVFCCPGESSGKSYFLLMSACIGLMWGAFSSTSIFMFLILFEAMVLPMFIFFCNFSKGKDKIISVLFMIFFNLSGSIPFMIFSWESMGTYSLDLSVCFEETFCWDSLLMLGCYTMVFLTKIPIFFFHFWLPKAHGSASGTCSMILASLVLKLGAFGLVKFGLSALPTNLCSCTICCFSMVGSLLFSFFMFRFFDLKYMIACSSVLHMSVIFPTFCLFQSMSIFSCFLMMVGHGLVSFYLFFLATLLYESSQTRSTSSNKSNESVCKNTTMIFYVSMLLNLSVPPTMNFLSEVEFSASLVSFSWIPLSIFAASLLSNIFFTILICSSMLFGKKVNLSAEITLPANNYSFLTMIMFLIFSPLVL